MPALAASAAGAAWTGVSTGGAAGIYPGGIACTAGFSSGINFTGINLINHTLLPVTIKLITTKYH